MIEGKNHPPQIRLANKYGAMVGKESQELDRLTHNAMQPIIDYLVDNNIDYNDAEAHITRTIGCFMAELRLRRGLELGKWDRSHPEE